MFFSTVASQYRGLRLSNGPFDQERFFASFRGASDRRGAHPHAGKARAQLIVRSLPPGDRAPSMLRQTERQLFGAQTRLQRTTIGHFTHFDRRHDPCRVFEPQSTDAGAQRGVGAVTRIDQHGTARHARRIGLADLLQRDLRFSLERDRIGNTCFLATGRVFCPFLRQIKPVRDRQAGMRGRS